MGLNARKNRKSSTSKSSSVDEANSHENQSTKLHAANSSIASSSQPEIVKTNVRSSFKPKTGTGQRLLSELYLPVSKRYIELTHDFIDPKLVKVGEYNQRNQELLSIDDPDVKALMESIKSDRQKEPILVRVVDGEWEAIYGSRRLYSVLAINEEREREKLDLIEIECWVGSDISDIDAHKLSIGENQNRTDISSYEKGLYCKKLYDAGKHIDEIAKLECVTSKTIRNWLELAQLPVEFVSLLESPKLISKESGIPLKKLISSSSDVEVADFISSKPNQSYKSIKKLKDDFSKFCRGSELTKESIPVNKPIVFEDNDEKGVKVKITRHRTKLGQYKIDMHDLSDEELTMMIDFFSSKYKRK